MGDIAYVLCAGQGPAAGPYAQGWGPLRVWPGGLCLSRALGDFDVGSLVLAIPHIMQVCSAGLHSRPEAAEDLCLHELAANCLLSWSSTKDTEARQRIIHAHTT